MPFYGDDDYSEDDDTSDRSVGEEYAEDDDSLDDETVLIPVTKAGRTSNKRKSAEGSREDLYGGDLRLDSTVVPGASCHKCKNRKLDGITFQCQSSDSPENIQRSKCKNKLCVRCLTSLTDTYRGTPHELVKDWDEWYRNRGCAGWKCPRCIGICNCANCKTKMAARGITQHTPAAKSSNKAGRVKKGAISSGSSSSGRVTEVPSNNSRMPSVVNSNTASTYYRYHEYNEFMSCKELAESFIDCKGGMYSNMLDEINIQALFLSMADDQINHTERADARSHNKSLSVFKTPLMKSRVMQESKNQLFDQTPVWLSQSHCG
jgi:hypothetical protein